MWLQVGRAVGLFERRTESLDFIREENSLLKIGIVGLSKRALFRGAVYLQLRHQLSGLVGTPARIKK
jgi:hypothetical protein